MHQQEAAFQVAGQEIVGLRFEIVPAGKRILLEPALILLAPVEPVASVVVIAGARHGHLEEIRIPENRVGGREPAARVAVDPDPVEVHEPIPGAELLGRGDLVGNAVVGHVAVVGVVERFRPARCAQGVDLDHDEAQFGQSAGFAARLEAVVDDRADLRSGIDMDDHWILPGGVDLRREVHEPVEIGGPVARLDRERHWCGPAGREHLGRVGLLEVEGFSPVDQSVHRRDWRQVGAGLGVDVGFAGGDERDPVVPGAGGQIGQSRTVGPDPHQMGVVRIGRVLA